MKAFSGFLLAALVVVTLASAHHPRGAAASALPAASASAPQEQTLYCPSDDMRRHECPADTRGGVQLTRQRSEADCIFNRTWGYTDRGIWVDRGCRADFEIGSTGWSGHHDTQTIYCASENMGPQRCPADTSRGVQLIRQRSEADCIYGRTWGYNDRGIWVDRGCRADFQVSGDKDDDWDDRDDRGSGDVQIVYCASDDMNRERCFADTRSGVRLMRQRSGSPCEYGRTWGYDNQGIWVDRGCRADFEVTQPR